MRRASMRCRPTRRRRSGSLLARCLERDPKLRLRDIGEARIMLRIPSMWPTTQNQGPPVRSPLHPSHRAALAQPRPCTCRDSPASWAGASSQTPASPFPSVDSICHPPWRPASSPSRAMAVASPFPGTDICTCTRCRPADARISAPVPAGTQGVFWSPDGRAIAYGAESTLRVVPVEGGRRSSSAKFRRRAGRGQPLAG